MYWAVSRALSGSRWQRSATRCLSAAHDGLARRSDSSSWPASTTGKLRRVGFEVDEQTDLFEQFIGQPLRFVDDERRRDAGRQIFAQPDVELGEQRRLGPGRRGAQREPAGEQLDELCARQGRVADRDTVSASLGDRGECGADERRLPGAGRPEHHRHPFALGDAVMQVGQRFLMLGHQGQVARIRRQVERTLLQTVEALVHGQSSTRT